MPTSATGSDPRPAADPRGGGFTLVELMVVLFIVGLASAAVLFALPDRRGSLRGEAERFAARVRAAQEAAVLDARPVALTLSPGGYAFATRAHGRWAAADEPALAPRRWGDGVAARETGGATRATFDPTGAVDPIELVLARDGARLTVSVAADGAVHVGG